MAIDVGDLVTIAVEIEDAAGAASDPAVLEFVYEDPAGNPPEAIAPLTAKGHPNSPFKYGVDVEIVRDSAGNYHIDLPVTVAGDWKYRWQSFSAGSVVRGAVEGEFYARPSQFD